MRAWASSNGTRAPPASTQPAGSAAPAATAVATATTALEESASLAATRAASARSSGRRPRPATSRSGSVSVRSGGAGLGHLDGDELGVQHRGNRASDLVDDGDVAAEPVADEHGLVGLEQHRGQPARRRQCREPRSTASR